jgi:hypothetical protein
MNSDIPARALAALDELRGLLQAAQFAAYRFEQVGPRDPLESLSDHIDRVKIAADTIRAGIQGSVRRAAIAQVPNLGRWAASFKSRLAAR